MKIAIWSIFLPRLEIYFLEEWIEHHMALGVSKFYLYSNGFYSHDNSKIGNATPYKVSNQEEGMVWSKKPLDDYNLDLSPGQILEKLESIEKKYKGAVEFKNWEASKANAWSLFHPKHPRKPHETFYKPYPGSQFTGAAHVRRTFKELLKIFNKNYFPSHWLFIDIDEFIMLHSVDSLKELILECAPKDCIVFPEVLFKERVNKKPVREIFEYGYHPTSIFKSLVKNSNLQRFNPHVPALKDQNGEVTLSRKTAEVFHYRGMPWGGIIRQGMSKELLKLVNRKKMCKELEEEMKKEFSKTNFSMKKYLETVDEEYTKATQATKEEDRYAKTQKDKEVEHQEKFLLKKIKKQETEENKIQKQ